MATCGARWRQGCEKLVGGQAVRHNCHPTIVAHLLPFEPGFQGRAGTEWDLLAEKTRADEVLGALQDVPENAILRRGDLLGASLPWFAQVTVKAVE